MRFDFAKGSEGERPTKKTLLRHTQTVLPLIKHCQTNGEEATRLQIVYHTFIDLSSQPMTTKHLQLSH